MNRIVRRRLVEALWMSGLGGLAGLGAGIVLGRLDQAPVVLIGLSGMVIGLVAGWVMGLTEGFAVPWMTRHLAFPRLSAARAALHAATLFLVLVAVNAARLMQLEELGFREAAWFFLRVSGLRDFVIAGVLAIAFTAAFQLRRLHAPGEIWQYLTGRYHYPVEERRVFLFADVVGSTGLAEGLGPVRYSRMIRDCFADVDGAIAAWRGQVFQHAGDSVIVTWLWDAGVRDGACLRCFFEMVDVLESRSGHYRREYGATVALRGGVHGGSVVTTWIGGSRMEMAFHGDPLNAAARLQSLCKTLEAQLLVSEPICTAIGALRGMDFVSRGEVELRGRRESMEVMAVERVDRSRAAPAPATPGSD